MQYPCVIGIYGRSNTGKTMLISELVTKFRREGFRVATIKQSTKPFTFDTKNSDTWRHIQAGAQTVLFSSPHNTILQIRQSHDEIQNLALLTYVEKIEIVLIEGSRHPSIPKIRIGSIQERENTVLTLTKDNVEIAYEFIKRYMTTYSKKEKLTLQVNGKAIALSDFPEDIMVKTLLGMLSSLHGVTDIDSFDISYRR